MEDKHMYKGNIVPSEDTIFVFGSNPSGKHTGGSAFVAMRDFGAIYGRGEGLQGHAYGIPTADWALYNQPNRLFVLEGLPKNKIIESIRKMYATARTLPEKKFKVAYRNQPNENTLCKYSGRELSAMFNEAGPIPSNVYFSQEWIENGLITNFEEDNEN